MEGKLDGGDDYIDCEEGRGIKDRGVQGSNVNHIIQDIYDDVNIKNKERSKEEEDCVAKSNGF